MVALSSGASPKSTPVAIATTAVKATTRASSPISCTRGTASGLTASRARVRREESIRKALDTLGMGAWVEFREPDDPSVRRPARLIFVSPHKSRYLFAVGRAGKEIIQCSRAEIGRRLRIGEAVKLDKPPEESLFDRIMGTLLGKLRGPMRLPLPTA